MLTFLPLITTFKLPSYTSSLCVTIKRQRYNSGSGTRDQLLTPTNILVIFKCTYKHYYYTHTLTHTEIEQHDFLESQIVFNFRNELEYVISKGFFFTRLKFGTESKCRILTTHNVGAFVLNKAMAPKLKT